MFECTICGKFYSSSSNLAIHVADVYKKEVTWSCPVCEDKVYSSKGGYHRHLRDRHHIGCNGDKLTPEKIKELRQAKKDGKDEKQMMTKSFYVTNILHFRIFGLRSKHVEIT